MKNISVILGLLLILMACGAKKDIDPETLPKDIALKSENNFAQVEDNEKLRALLAEIEAQINSQPCTDPNQWRISPIGAKPCGGPSSYLAYPVRLEEEILPKIANFTQLKATFNKKYGLMSDCAIVPEPSAIRCEKGKAVLVGSYRGALEVQ